MDFQSKMPAHSSLIVRLCFTLIFIPSVVLFWNTYVQEDNQFKILFKFSHKPVPEMKPVRLWEAAQSYWVHRHQIGTCSTRFEA